MKLHSSLLCLLIVGSAWAQSQLPPCQGNFPSRWSNCTGSWTNPGNEKYQGEWLSGKPYGQGTHTLASGERYIGTWRDGKYHGPGVLYAANGSVIGQGTWVNNELVKGSSAGGTQPVESQKTPPLIPPDNRRRLALVIGNDNYSSMPVLNNAVNDSKAMSDALRLVNFEVLYFKNLNKRGMEEALYTFVQKLGEDHVGMFYFAGHGVQANGKNFLIPVAENVKKPADVQFEGIDVNRVMAYLQDSKNSLNIVILDACRSSLPERGGVGRGLAVTEATQGSIVAYATSPGKAASDGDEGSSPFTRNLIRVMQRKGMKIEDVFKEVRQSVIRETNGEQVPQEVSQLVGDFYFRP